MSIDETPFRAEFILPTNKSVGAVDVDKALQDEPCTYLCGNSLGALPKRSVALLQEEMDAWGTKAVEGHFDHPYGRPWASMTDHVNPLLAELVGAKPSEVSCQSTLTANLHLLMSTFYKPTSTRYKIMCEHHAFPSDQYAFTSQALLHGLDPAKAIIELKPRVGEFTLREEDMLEAIEKEGKEVALVIFSGLQYYTGQLFPIERITRAAKAQGCICGWDLAHAIGNVPMSLHDWDIDFAVWCTYKYVNSGPGGIGGLYVHEKWDDVEKPKLAGWYGHELSTRFQMPPDFRPIRGAQGYVQSNPSALIIATLLGSLQIFKEAGMMSALRARALKLTRYLESLLVASSYYVPPGEVAKLYPGAFESSSSPEADTKKENEGKPAFTIITPSDPEARGTQLSMLFLPVGGGVMQKVFASLKNGGVIGDEREPDVIRLAPTALYNTKEDCEKAAEVMERAFNALVQK